jgi:hypothetical protein
VGALRGAGNAINLAQAQGFVEAVIELRSQPQSLAACPPSTPSGSNSRGAGDQPIVERGRALSCALALIAGAAVQHRAADAARRGSIARSHRAVP